MKVDWNQKYTTIAIYSFLVIAASLLLAFFLLNFDYFSAQLADIANILEPFGYAFVLAYVLNPLLKRIEGQMRLKNRKAKRGLCILITYLIMLLFISTFMGIIVPQVVDSIAQITRSIPSYIQSMDNWAQNIMISLPEGWAEWLTETMQSDRTAGWFTEMLEKVYVYMQTYLPVVGSYMGRFTSSVVNFILGIIISIYILMSKERFFAQAKKVLNAFFKQRTVEMIVHTTRDANKKFGGFIIGKLLDSLIIGILCFIGMSILQIPYALLVSVVVGITNVIPYFGPFIGAIPSVLFILTVSPIKALWFAIFVLALQQFDGNILGPRILGDSTGLSAFWVIFSILLFGGRMGFIGMLIGVPLFAVIYSSIKGIVQYFLWKKGLPLETAEYASEHHDLID